jgi:hypothetical protein
VRTGSAIIYCKVLALYRHFSIESTNSKLGSTPRAASRHLVLLRMHEESTRTAYARASSADRAWFQAHPAARSYGASHLAPFPITLNMQLRYNVRSHIDLEWPMRVNASYVVRLSARGAVSGS